MGFSGGGAGAASGPGAGSMGGAGETGGGGAGVSSDGRVAVVWLRHAARASSSSRRRAIAAGYHGPAATHAGETAPHGDTPGRAQWQIS